MIDKVISEIAVLSVAIKAKDNSQSFNKTELEKFEFIYFLTMDIVKRELIISGELSDLTSGAISQLFAFQCFEFYYRDFSEIFSKTTALFTLLCEYNVKLKNNDLEGKISSKPSDWVLYFKEILQKLL